MRTKPKFTCENIRDIIFMVAEDLGIEDTELEYESTVIDTFLINYLLANVSDITALWNDEE